MTQVGRVPVRGELVPGPGGFEIEVLDADPRRVKTRAHSPQQDRKRRDRDGRAPRRASDAAPPTRGDRRSMPQRPSSVRRRPARP